MSADAAQPSPRGSSSSSELAVQQGRATPSDVVAALRGSTTVTLSGFAAQVRSPTFLRPGVQFVSPSISGEELRGVLIARGTRLRVIWVIAMVCSHLALAAGAVFFWREFWPSQAQEISQALQANSGAWTAIAVQVDGVVIEVGQAGRAATFAVPVGGRLPGGEVLTLVDPQRSMYATSSARVFLIAGGRP